MPLNYFGSRSVKRALSGQTPGDEPISAELFSVERLEHFAESLAADQAVVAAPSTGISLRGRLRENAAVLNAAYCTLIAGARHTPVVTPAAAWLMDNFHIVDAHIRAIRRDLPPGYYRQLPKLAGGPLRGYPRVYGLGWALVAHTDSRFELDTLHRFCRAYQRVQPLTIGELWAIAITLRVVLIENLRRLAAGIASRRDQRARANALADSVLHADPGGSDAHPPVLRGLEGEPLPNPFAAQLFQRLRDHDPETTPALAWLHARLAAQGTTADDVVHGEHQRQGAVNVSVRNVITSLRLISSVDWAKFVEGISLVDELLRSESNFAAIDFAGRDLYRHAIEDLARGSMSTELEVTRRALDAARRDPAGTRDSAASTQRSRETEPGYYLVCDGRAALEREIGYRAPLNRRLGRWMRSAGH